MIPQRSRGRATAAAGASLVVVLALVDLVVDESAVLIPLLVLGPLMAAISAEVRATAAVGAMAIVLAAALGAADEGIFDPQHVVQVMVVIAGSFFAVAAAVARSRFEAAERAAAAALAGEREARIQANMIARASELLATTLDPEERLAQVVALAVPELADVGTVDLLEPDGSLRGAASDAAEPGVAQSVLDGRRRWPIDPASAHPVAVAARTGRPQLISTMSPEHLEETAQSPGHLELMRGLGYSSGIAVPLVARGRTLGVIAFVRRAGREPYDQDDLRLAIELARRSATAVDNARLFAELRRTERQLEAVLGNLAEAVTVQAPDHSLLYVNYAAAHLLECRSPEEVLSTPMQEILARFIPLDEDGGPFDYSRLPGRHALAGETPEPVLMRNISLATGDERWMLVKSTPVRDVDGDVAMAVNIIEDVTDARRTEYHQRFLAGASKLLSASLDVDATLERAAAALVPEIADWCWVDVPDERGRLVRRAVAVDPDRADEVAALRDAIGSGPAGTEAARVLDDGRPRLHARVDEELLQGWASGAALDTLRRAGLRSVLTVPLVAGTRVVGTMTMGTDRSGRALGELELALAEELGIRAGVATENARLHATRTHIATTLQRSLLPPRLPAVPGMTISARFRAAGEATEVGGDFYDLFPVSEGWMVIMGDVTGKGPEAAAITSLARYTMRTAAGYERSPAGVLERLNATLVVDPDRRRLCTVVCARIIARPDGHAVVTVAGAGHPPPFVLRGGHAERVAVAGPLLGAFEGVGWMETEVDLAPGESLVLYTDGVTDASNEEERFGEERLEAVLDGAADLGPDGIASRVDEALHAFERGPQRDDVALLVLQATAEPGATDGFHPQVARTSQRGA